MLPNLNPNILQNFSAFIDQQVFAKGIQSSSLSGVTLFIAKLKSRGMFDKKGDLRLSIDPKKRNVFSYLLSKDYSFTHKLLASAWLLKKKANFNYEGKDVRSPLFHAILLLNDASLEFDKENILNMIDLFIANGIDVCATDSNGFSLFSQFCIYIDFPKSDVCKALLSREALSPLLNNRGDHAKSPLFHAIFRLSLAQTEYEQKNLLKIIDLFIAHGADINAVDVKGDSLICHLCDVLKVLKSDLFELLLNRKAHLNFHGDLTHSPLYFVVVRLHLAESERERQEVLKILDLFIIHGADLSALDSAGRSVLSYYCILVEFPKFHVCEALLIRKAGLNYEGDFENFPLFAALCYANHADTATDREEAFKIVDLLVAHGADLNRMDKAGRSLFYYFLNYEKSPQYKICEWLLNHHVLLTYQGPLFNSPLFLTVWNLNRAQTENEIEETLKILDLLIARGADLNAMDSRGRSLMFYILFYTEMTWKPFCIKTLMEKGLSLVTKDSPSLFEVLISHFCAAKTSQKEQEYIEILKLFISNEEVTKKILNKEALHLYNLVRGQKPSRLVDFNAIIPSLKGMAMIQQQMKLLYHALPTDKRVVKEFELHGMRGIWISIKNLKKHIKSFLTFSFSSVYNTQTKNMILQALDFLACPPSDFTEVLSHPEHPILLDVGFDGHSCFLLIINHTFVYVDTGGICTTTLLFGAPGSAVTGTFDRTKLTVSILNRLVSCKKLHEESPEYLNTLKECFIHELNLPETIKMIPSDFQTSPTCLFTGLMTTFACLHHSFENFSDHLVDKNEFRNEKIELYHEATLRSFQYLYHVLFPLHLVLETTLFKKSLFLQNSVYLPFVEELLEVLTSGGEWTRSYEAFEKMLIPSEKTAVVNNYEKAKRRLKEVIEYMKQSSSSSGNSS